MLEGNGKVNGFVARFSLGDFISSGPGGMKMFTRSLESLKNVPTTARLVCVCVCVLGSR